jgi:succinyl-CoA synthetase alpha subunit
MSGAIITPETPVIVQGATGRTGRRHAVAMRAYGTNIVGGVSPKSAATEQDGMPIFKTCRDAVAATGAEATVIMVPPLAVLSAVTEAADAGLKLIISVAEGMPVADAITALECVRAAGARWIGPSTPGLAIPGRVKLGFLPDVSLLPGPLGIMAKSGTLSYEVCYRLAGRGVGQSLWIGVGGETVKGTRFADLIPVFEDDPATKAIVLMGEVGGFEEEEFAAALTRLNAQKPVYAIIAGNSAREGVTMGHAGALVHGDTGTIESKTKALRGAGVQVFTRMQDLVEAICARSWN